MDQPGPSLLQSVPSMDLMLQSSIVMHLSTSKKVNCHYKSIHGRNDNSIFVCLFVANKVSRHMCVYKI